MKTTLKQVFDTYPLKASKIAVALGRSREWINMLTSSSHKWANHKDNLQLVQDWINKTGEELATIQLSGQPGPDVMEISSFFNAYPFTVAGIAKHMGYTREFVSSIVFNRYKNSDKARERNIKRIQKTINRYGIELQKINLV